MNISNVAIINTITIIIDDSDGISRDLGSLIMIFEELLHNLEHPSRGVIYKCNIFIV